MVERGYVVPGSFVVASDSHSNMYGALGAIGTPIVRTDAAAVWATGEFWWQIPRSVEVRLEGKLPEGATGKDVIITLCGLYNHDEVLNAAIEFTGPGVASLSMDARLSISNMTTEWGPLVGWFPVDEVTITYLRGVHQRLKALGVERFTEGDLAGWAKNPPRPDPDAVYAAKITLDLSQVTPHVSGPDTVQVMQSLAEMERKKVAIQKAYLVSCVNSRLEDLEAAAQGFERKESRGGRSVLPGRGQQMGAGRSREARHLANADRLRARNRCRLDAGRASAWVLACLRKAKSASRPRIAISKAAWARAMRNAIWQAPKWSPRRRLRATSAARTSSPTAIRRGVYTELAAATAGSEKVEILPGFPARVKGRLVFMPQDNVNTDAIYGKDYTYRDDMTPEMMAKVVMENYDPQFAARTQAGDVIVGGFNFGTGSSREQAVTCLKAKGIPLVIAASFSQTYLRNAYNNGFLCVEVPELVKRLREQFASQIAAKEKTLIPRRRNRYRLHCERDPLARRRLLLPGARQRSAVAGDRARRGEPGGETLRIGLSLRALRGSRIYL